MFKKKSYTLQFKTLSSVDNAFQFQSWKQLKGEQARR